MAALIKRILYLFLVVIATTFAYMLAYWQESVWLFASVLLLLNLSLETTLWRRTIEIASTTLLTVTLVFCGTLLAALIPAQIIFFSIVTGCCVYMGAKYSQSAYAWFIINFLTVLSLQSDASFSAAIQHVDAVLAGAAIVLLAQIILLPFFNRDEYHRSRRLTLYRLSRMSSVIFTCLLSPDYPDNIYLYERRVHKQKIKCLNRMSLLSAREKAAGKSVRVSYEMQTLFEMIIDIGQIRRRVTDHTVFALCSDELTGINVAINQTFTALGANNQKKIADGLRLLYKYIIQFESNYEHILRVTAREPLVILLMLGTLKSLLEECQQISGVTLQSAEEAV